MLIASQIVNFNAKETGGGLDVVREIEAHKFAVTVLLLCCYTYYLWWEDNLCYN